MIIVPVEKLRKYISFENGSWIHDPNMPDELMEDYILFVHKYEEQERRLSNEYAEEN